jgi:hypothetical protein
MEASPVLELAGVIFRPVFKLSLCMHVYLRQRKLLHKFLKKTDHVPCMFCDSLFSPNIVLRFIQVDSDKILVYELVVAVCTCNHAYLVGEGRRIVSSRPSCAIWQDPISKEFFSIIHTHNVFVSRTDIFVHIFTIRTILK